MQVSTTYTYDQFGNITRESVAATNQLTRITDFTYDASGRFLVRQLVNNPDFSGQIEFQNYSDLWGKPQRIIDVNGQRTDIMYDIAIGDTPHK
jgi:hypothetical protein